MEFLFMAIAIAAIVYAVILIRRGEWGDDDGSGADGATGSIWGDGDSGGGDGGGGD